MMMAPPQVVGVLLKKPGEQSHSILSPIDPQETKIRGELYVEDLNERRIVLVRMGWLWVEGTQMKLPLRALNLRQATSGICQPHVLALGFTLSNSQGHVLATFWADTEPIYWSWVRAIAAELVRQTPPRAQRCLNFLEILTICPRGPIPLPGSPTEPRRRSRSEFRCWLGDSPITGLNARGAAIIDETRRRARSELRGWSSSNSSDEDLHLTEFRGLQKALLPKVETAMTARIWGCSESSEGSDDSLPWVGGCRSSVDSIDSGPAIPEPDARELRIQRYKEARRRENEARSRRVLEEDAKRRKARQEENNNNNNNNNESKMNTNNARTIGSTPDAVAERLTDATTSEKIVGGEKSSKNNSNNGKTTLNNAKTIDSCSDAIGERLKDATASEKTMVDEKLSKNNRNNGKTTRQTTVVDTPTGNADSVAGRRSEITNGDPPARVARKSGARDNGNNAETTKIPATPNNFDDIAESGKKAAQKLSDIIRRAVRNSNEPIAPKERKNNVETTPRTTKTTRSNVSTLAEVDGNSYKNSEREKLTKNSRNNFEATKTTKIATTESTTRSREMAKSTEDPFVRAAATVDAITRRLPPLRVSSESPIVRFRDDTKNNNNNATENHNNNRTTTTRCKPDSPPSPGIVRTDSSERRSRARERRNIREKQQTAVVQQPQQSRIPETSLKTIFLQERRERLSLMSRISNVDENHERTNSTPRILERTLDRRERGAISLPRTTTTTTTTTAVTAFETIGGTTGEASCEEDVARLLERCQRVDRYVPVREKLTLFESLSRMGGRLARSTEDLGRSFSRPSPKGKQRARSLHDLNRPTRSVPVREMCRLFEGEKIVESVNDSVNNGSSRIVSGGASKIGDRSSTNAFKESPLSILKNCGNHDVPPCVRTSTRRKHYQK